MEEMMIRIVYTMVLVPGYLAGGTQQHAGKGPLEMKLLGGGGAVERAVAHTVI